LVHRKSAVPKELAGDRLADGWQAPLTAGPDTGQGQREM